MKTLGLVIAVLVIGGIYLLMQPQSDSEKYSECTVDAGKIYDSNRQTITANQNGYSAEEQNYYYQQTDRGYSDDLEACRKIYGNK